jgi:large subunit ribosomal protein L25
MTILNTKPRQKEDNLQSLRKSGQIPAIFYGKKTEPTSVSISKTEFLKIWKESGESGVVNLKGDKISVDVLIHDVQFDPVSGDPLHVDFYVFEKGKKIEISVPLEFVGVSAAVKDLGGSLVKVLHELKVKADPQNIPHEISVDISKLETFDSQVLASDIVLPSGVDLVELPTEVVASVSEPKSEEETSSEPVDLSSIEVEKKGKKEENTDAETQTEK